MMRLTTFLLALLLLVASGFTTSAQNPENAYAGLPQWRGQDGAFVLGDASARMRLIEFSDFLCGFCQNYEPIVAQFIQKYVMTGKAQFEYRMFPVVDAKLSPLSAAVAECADTLSPGAFWTAHDLLFDIASNEGFSEASPARIAAALDLDTDALVNCAADARQYQVDQLYGLELGVEGTPSLFVQYGEAPPLAIAHALPEHFPALVDALRPQPGEAVEIAAGAYAGLKTFRSADGGFVLGDPAAPLTIVAFEDFLCPHCQAYVETVHSFIDSQVRAGKAQFEYRFYPLVDAQRSVPSAQIAECIGQFDLGKFWQGHDLLFELAKAGRLGADSTSEVAAALDLDAAALASCVERSIQFLIDIRLSQSLGISGTPAIRARRDGGAAEIIFTGQQALDRGGLPLDTLTALAEGREGVSVGQPEASLLDASMLEDANVLTAEPCAPPCWQNITPSQTTMEEALQIVSQMQSLTVASATDAEIIFSQGSGAPCCQIASDDQGIVAAILLQLAPETGVGAAIQELGEPQYVTGMPYSDQENLLVLIYPDEASFLYAMVAGADEPLSEGSPVVSALFATRAQMDQVTSMTPLDHWKGYLSFSAYMDGQFDHNA